MEEKVRKHIDCGICVFDLAAGSGLTVNQVSISQCETAIATRFRIQDLSFGTTLSQQEARSFF